MTAEKRERPPRATWAAVQEESFAGDIDTLSIADDDLAQRRLDWALSVQDAACEGRYVPGPVFDAATDIVMRDGR